jgi:thioredoxin 1
MSEHIQAVTDGDFETEVLKSPLPVLVDYWADWCAPCRALGPVVDEISEDYDGRLKVTKMDIDQNPKTPAGYGIRNIPTLMLFKDGNLVATKVGLLSKSQLTSFIDSHI